MRTDGIFTTKQVRVPNWQMGKTMTLVPFGDIHHDSPAHSEEAFTKFIDHVRTMKDVLFLGMGDYMDSFSTSERIIMYDTRLHDSTRRREEKESQGRVKSLAAKIQFMRGKLIGLMGGNHFPLYSDGTTGDQLLARELGTVYLGACCAIRITFSCHGHTVASVDIFAHHGRGGGTTAGGRFNSVEKLRNICDADIFLMGDNHARGCFPAGDRLHLVSNARGLFVKSKSRWVGRTGSFLRGYVENEPSYVVDMAMPPANLGHIEFTLTPTRSKVGGHDIIYVEIGAVQ